MPAESIKSRLKRLRRRAALTLLWEELWPPLAFAGVVAVVFVAASWFGLWFSTPPTLRLVALAAFAGVLAAPIYQVRPGMGADIIAVVFAVVVIGGMGSILGSILTGFALGVIEGLTKVFYPEVSNTVVFVIMAIVLIIRPSGLFGRVA